MFCVSSSSPSLQVVDEILLMNEVAACMYWGYNEQRGTNLLNKGPLYNGLIVLSAYGTTAV